MQRTLFKSRGKLFTGASRCVARRDHFCRRLRRPRLRLHPTLLGPETVTSIGDLADGARARWLMPPRDEDGAAKRAAACLDGRGCRCVAQLVSVSVEVPDDGIRFRGDLLYPRRFPACRVCRPWRCSRLKESKSRSAGIKRKSRESIGVDSLDSWMVSLPSSSLFEGLSCLY